MIELALLMDALLKRGWRGHWPNSVVAATNRLALPTPGGSLKVTDLPELVESPSASIADCRISFGLPPELDIKLAFSDASLDKGSGLAPIDLKPEGKALSLLRSRTFTSIPAGPAKGERPMTLDELLDPARWRELLRSLETEDLESLQVFVELEDAESFRDDDICESCDGFLVTVQEFRRR